MYNRELMVSYVNSGHRKYLAIINERWSHGTLIDEGSETGKCIKGRSLSWWRGGLHEHLMFTITKLSFVRFWSLCSC